MKRLVSALVALATLAAGCSASETTATDPPVPTAVVTAPPPTATLAATTSVPTTAAESGFPVTVVALNGDVTIESLPTRIVSLSPTATEVLFAIGAGDQVVAVDSLSNFPSEAPMSDLSAFTPNIEAIAEFNPDLVVISYDPGGVVSTLNGLGIVVVVQSGAFSLDEAYAQIEVLGAATGHIGDAAGVVGEMQTDLALITAAATVREVPLTYFYELGPELYSATSTTFIGEIFSLLGLENIADAEDPDGWGYPQLTVEHIIDANPDLVFLADTICCAQDLASVAARPGWEGLRAVTDGGVVELNDDVASRWGPRIVDLLKAVAEAVVALESVDA
jgi:iron complex transport system substrate-binding protein